MLIFRCVFFCLEGIKVQLCQTSARLGRDVGEDGSSTYDAYRFW